MVRNFPIVGHCRYRLEAVGPELRQYIVTGNDEERPFSRDQRRWVYASSKHENEYFGFGTDNDLERTPGHVIVAHATLGAAPLPRPVPPYRLPCAKVLGGYRERRGAFRPDSVVNVSGMSLGALSGRAIEAINRGAKEAGCLHNTGGGGIARAHGHGGALVWQIGNGYFGCRAERGRFDMARALEWTRPDARSTS